MHSSSGRIGVWGTSGHRLALALLASLSLLALPAGASAKNLFSAAAHPEGVGPIVTDSAGTGYLAWVQSGSEPNQTFFCKIPRGGTCTDEQELPLPLPHNSSTENVTEPFPVLGAKAGVVYVVAPRYSLNDTLIWTSEDGGEKFSAPKKESYSDGSAVGDVLRNPLSPTSSATSDLLDIASFNSSLGFSEVGDLDGSPFGLRFENVAYPNGQGSTLGFTEAGAPVEAYWTFAAPYEVAFFYLATGATKTEADWSHPKAVTKGYEPRLASGPKGLFLLSTDVASGEEQPTLLDVRKWNETSKTFGAPTLVATIAPSVFSLFNGGGMYENPETGALDVVAPIAGATNAVMHLWESTDGGQTFHGEREVAVINGSYYGPPRLAVAADGQGWLSFTDEGGLEVADLNPQTAPVTPVVPTPAPVPTPTALTTTQSGDGFLGASVTVPQGMAVTDQAHISGAHAAGATGSVTYNLYKDKGCTVAAAPGSVATVSKGVAGVSSAVKPKAGTYYWRASYSGDALNSGSSSPCGSEILVVAVQDTSLGLPSTKICLSRRKFVVHPRAPKGVKLVSVEILINGKLAKKGTLSNRETTVSLIGLPKGTFRVALITKSSKGKTYEDVRTFHTCVPKKRKK